MIIQNGVEIASTIKIISPEEYEQLSDTEKKNGTTYLITGYKEINRELSFLKKIIGDFEGLKKNLPDDFPEEEKTILGILKYLNKAINDTIWWRQKRVCLVNTDHTDILLNSEGERIYMNILRNSSHIPILPLFEEPVGDYTDIFIKIKKILSKSDLTEKYLNFVKETGHSTISGALSNLLVKLDMCTISHDLDEPGKIVIKKKDKILLEAEGHEL